MKELLQEINKLDDYQLISLSIALIAILKVRQDDNKQIV